MEEIKNILDNKKINLVFTIFAIILFSLVIFDINSYWNAIIIPFSFIGAILACAYIMEKEEKKTKTNNK